MTKKRAGEIALQYFTELHGGEEPEKMENDLRTWVGIPDEEAAEFVKYVIRTDTFAEDVCRLL